MTDIIKLLKPIFKHWYIIFACTVFMAALMVFLTMSMPKIYESSASIYTGINTGVGILGQDRQDYSAQYAAYDNMANIITSRETFKEVGLRLLAMHMSMTQVDPRIISAEHLEAKQKMIPTDIKKLAGATDSITYLNLDAIADTHPFLIGVVNYPEVPYYSTAALSSVAVSRVRSSDMISLVYTCDDPGVCQKTLEILIDVCIRNYRQIKEGQTDKKVTFFEEQLQLAQSKLKQAEAQEEQFKKSYGVANLSIQTELAISDRQDITNQILKEQEILATTAAGMRQIEGQLGVQAQSMKRSDIMLKYDQLGRLSQRLTSAQLNGASSSQIASLQTQINQVKEDLNRDITSNLTPATAGRTTDVAATEYFNKSVAYEESKARLKALENRRNAASGVFTKYLPLADTLKRIQRNIDISEKEYLAALDNLNQSKRQQQDQRSFSTIQIIDKPNFPLTAKSSKRKILVMLGMMIGFVVPSSIFLGMAYFNGNIQTPQRAEETTGLETVGIMPDTRKLRTLKDPEMVSDGLSDTILKNLYLADYKSGQMRILIISTRAGEGKTMISNMLCERLRDKGRKCLVVMPYVESGSWSVVSYKVDKSFYQARAEDIVPVERMSEADILIIELPPLIMNDYPVELIRQFDMAFLICKANREWVKADQMALDSFVRISGITPRLILNNVELDVVEEILGKVV
ncbi:MAG: hypothetical protein LBL04_18040 [Bacteroidales bacterium]|jgi:uncharacterized protein involved in exopolysaccharide biosynthesis|nr:hypothetical protein [Bacteroidales bacterium]